MNTLTVSGFLIKDPELKKSAKGTDYCNFTINNKTGFGDKQNSNFFNCIIYGVNATNLCKYKKKGDYIYVIGEINILNYENAEGVKKQTIQITANNLDFPPHTKVSSDAIERTYDQKVEGNYEGYGKQIANEAGMNMKGNPFFNNRDKGIRNFSTKDADLEPNNNDISADNLPF